MNYSVAIRTLGKAGAKYQQTLDSIKNQTITPQKILIYIAEGYPIPEETIGSEQYIYVRKGMLAQRALDYNEVETEYLLLLDDDVYLPPDAVEKLYTSLIDNKADLVSPDVFHNHLRSKKSALMMALTGRMKVRKDDGQWAYKVMRTAGYSYNGNPQDGCYLSETNAGPCCFCRKNDFLSINLNEESWLDKSPYALGDDQVMFYKMFKKGFKQLTLFGSGIEHLDAGMNLGNPQKEKQLIFADFRFKTIFWHRFILLPDKNALSRFYSWICIIYALGLGLLVSLLKGQFHIFVIKRDAILDGIHFIKSDSYKNLPII